MIDVAFKYYYGSTINKRQLEGFQNSLLTKQVSLK